MFRTLLLSSALVFISFCTFAQTPLPPEFAACSRIQKNGERLACYDRAVAYLSQPPEQQTTAPSAETSFGLQADVSKAPARAAESAGDDESAEVSSVTARVAEVTSERDGKKVVTLDNGQTWRELTGSTYSALKAGDEVTISRAALGSFMMSVPNGRPVRVRRVK